MTFLRKISAAVMLSGAIGLSLTSIQALAAAYDIAPGDLLMVNVYRQEDMTLRVRVDTRGYIRFPMAGRFSVAGKSADTIEREISAALRRQGFSQPEVVVSVDTYAPRNVYVLGQVKNASESSDMQIPLGGEMSALQAISNSGGLTDDADIDRIIVRRYEAGKIRTIPVPARDILNGKPIADVQLKPSDTVVVPKMPAISVLGTAKKPGQFYPTPEAPLTVSRVLALAGGVDRPNSLSEIRITRGKQTFEVDVRSVVEKGKDGQDPELKPGDIVYVPETRW
jgi:polysaccharide export outer membrane protein